MAKQNKQTKPKLNRFPKVKKYSIRIFLVLSITIVLIDTISSLLGLLH